MERWSASRADWWRATVAITGPGLATSRKVNPRAAARIAGRIAVEAVMLAGTIAAVAMIVVVGMLAAMIGAATVIGRSVLAIARIAAGRSPRSTTTSTTTFRSK